MSGDGASQPRRVYLDNAATTWPKCEAAVEASVDFIRNCGATSGRGTYASAQVADRWLERARHRLGRLLDTPTGKDIAFCGSGTHALNAVLQGVLKTGDHVLTTSMEHNSVLRPLTALARDRGVLVDVLPADAQGRATPDQAEDKLCPQSRMLVLGHASNVTGAVNDLSSWSQFAKKYGLWLVVDASQTLGYLPISVSQLGIDALAAAGHKGLRALQGTGLVFLNEELQETCRPLMLGGTGQASHQVDDRPAWPQTIEVGNLNLPGIISMAVAADELLQLDDLTTGWLDVFEYLLCGLRELPRTQLLGEYDPVRRPPNFVPVASVLVEDWAAHDLAAVLADAFHVEVRAGWHCAALVHRGLGTEAEQGTLRISTGRTTTRSEVDYLLAAMKEILES